MTYSCPVKRNGNGNTLTRQGSRYTIRLRKDQARRLAALGKLNKRRIAAMMRDCLDDTLNLWEASQ